MKCKDCDNYGNCQYYENRRETSQICKEFDNHWKFIEELENLLQVMIKRTKQVGHTDGWYMGSGTMINIVERRIAELKGEEYMPEYEKKMLAELIRGE